MSAGSDKPLVTIGIIAYNQETVIRAAIEGAFAQTYTPLEIILSDDCSPDGTFEIMQQMAASYEGPHRIVVNQTPGNLRMIGHINQVVEKSTGAFFVANAGDDVSKPDRVETLVDVWQKRQGRIMLVHSAAEEITHAGVPTGVIKGPPDRVRHETTPASFIRDRGFVLGATAGWDRRIFDEFGPLGPNLSTEDRVLPFRATLLGDVAYVDTPLLGHRMDGVSSAPSAPPGWEYLYGISHKLRKWTAEIDRYVLQHYADIDYPEKASVEATCRDRGARLQFMVDLAEAGYGRRLVMLPQAVRRCLQDRSLKPFKHWLRYVLDKPYMAYANRRGDSDTSDRAPDPLGKE